MPPNLEKRSIKHMHQSKPWYLKQIEVFADLPEADKRELQEITQMVSYRKHEPICFPGQPADTV